MDYFYRSSTTLVVSKASKEQNLEFPKHALKYAGYSPDGKHIAYFTATDVVVMSTDCEKLWTKQLTVIDMKWSKTGRFLFVFQRYLKSDEAVRNLIVFDWKNDRQLFSTLCKTGLKDLEIGMNDQVLLFKFNGHLKSYLVEELLKGNSNVFDTLKLNDRSIETFSASNEKNCVAVHIGEHQGQPSIVRLYSLPVMNSVLANKTFFKGDRVEFKWNYAGTQVIAISKTDVDKSGKSYYGEMNLYLLSVGGSFDCRIALDKEGPVHDVAWLAVKNQFLVCYGFMPAKTALFDQKANIVCTLSVNPRNYLNTSLGGSTAVVAGLGNLSGDMDVIATNSGNTISTFNAHGITQICTCPSNDSIISVATLSPRLRVDNGFVIFDFSSSPKKTLKELKAEELFQFQWCPSNTRKIYAGTPQLSAAKGSSPLEMAPTKSAYVPPHLRKGNRGKVAAAKPDTPKISEEEKQIRKIKRKLMQIQELKEKINKGEALETNQLNKMEQEDSLLEELSKLEIE